MSRINAKASEQWSLLFLPQAVPDKVHRITKFLPRTWRDCLPDGRRGLMLQTVTEANNLTDFCAIRRRQKASNGAATSWGL